MTTILATLSARSQPHNGALDSPSQLRRVTMASFKDPSFQDRAASAAKAKQKALDQLKLKPAVDEDQMAERRRALELREQALHEERTAKAAARAAAKAEKEASRAAEIAEAEAAAAAKAERLKPATAAEMKAARDARYAARKARK
jgi:hypothetical protein